MLATSLIRTKNTDGFTLVELLVTIAIIGILIGMTLPAINSVRESARITSCQSKLSQIALGMLSCEAAHGVFPPGQLGPVDLDGDYQFDNDDNQMVGHLGFVMPFLEQGNLRSGFDSINWGLHEYGDPWYENASLLQLSDVKISSFRCPSDYEEPLRRLAVGSSLLGPHGQVASFQIPVSDSFQGWTNYLGSMGPRSQNGTLEGIFFERSRIRTQDITDGLSNTILAGEVLGGDDEPAFARRPIKVRHSFFSNGIQGSRFFFDDNLDTTDHMVVMFSSRHRGGHLVNFAYADGHVQNHVSSTSSRVLTGLTTRNGGEIQ